jgi:hypothetical protein
MKTDLVQSMKRLLPLWFVLLVGLFASAIGCRKKEVALVPSQVPVEAEATGLLSIQHLKHGLEQFKVKDARCNLYQHKDGVWEFVVKVVGGEATRRAKKLEEARADAMPKFEATALLPADELELVAGRVVTQREAFDHKRNVHLSNLYYFTHNSVDDLRVELIEVTDEWIDARVTGKALVNGDDGMEPDATISVRVKFKRDKELRREIG